MADTDDNGASDRTEMLTVRFSRDEIARIRAATDRNGLAASSWVRWVVLRALRESES